MLLRFIEIAFVLSVAWLLVSQILIPAIRNTQMFPFIRREQKLKKVLVELNQEGTEIALAKAIEQISAEHAKEIESIVHTENKRENTVITVDPVVNINQETKGSV